MAGFVFFCNLLYTIAGTAVALRLLRLARRTGGAPERIIGTGLLSFSLFCQPLLVAASGALGEPPLWGYRLLIGTAVATSATTVICLYLFCWRVFRPQSRVAGVVVALGALAAAACGVGIASQPPLYSDEPANLTWLALSSFNYVVCFVWAGIESLVYYARMRRRAAIGLAEPEVQNRFAVWGFTMLAGASLSVAVGLSTGAGMRIGVDAFPSLCVAASGLINSAGWWLSFAPPVAYLNWVRGRASVAST